MPPTGLASPTHLLLLLFIALLLFGGKRLPEIGRSLGSSVREFRQSFAREDPSSPATGDDRGDSDRRRPETGEPAGGSTQFEPRPEAADSKPGPLNQWA